MELAAQDITVVDVERARELLASDDPPVLVDTREPAEWSQGHLEGATLVPPGDRYRADRLGRARP